MIERTLDSTSSSILTFDNNGNWDYDGLATQMAVIDNIDTIIQSVYKKGRVTVKGT